MWHEKSGHSSDCSISRNQQCMYVGIKHLQRLEHYRCGHFIVFCNTRTAKNITKLKLRVILINWANPTAHKVEFYKFNLQLHPYKVNLMKWLRRGDHLQYCSCADGLQQAYDHNCSNEAHSSLGISGIVEKSLHS